MQKPFIAICNSILISFQAMFTRELADIAKGAIREAGGFLWI